MPVAAAVMLLSGCAHVDRTSGTDSPSQAPATVEVSNHNWATINVYAVRSSMRSRLGTVESNETRTFRVPDTMIAGAGSIRLMASPIGSTRTHMTDEILVRPGERIEWNLENWLPMSSYAVYSGRVR